MTRGEDGKFRWVCERDLFRAGSVFFLVWRIFFFLLLGVFTFTILMDAIQWPAEFWTRRLPDDLRFFAYVMLGMTALVGVGYLIYAAVMGGKYVVEFEMDEQGVTHRQIESQAKKARRLGRAAASAGLAAGRPSAAGAGLAAQRTEMTTAFARVRALKADRRRGVIHLREGLSRNQVYVCDEDFAFVRDYLFARCPSAKKKG